MMQDPLYLGLDLSTQQLKAIVVDSTLNAVRNVTFDFDAESTGFKIEKGVITDLAEHEVYAPVALWLQALDGVLQKLKDTSLDLARIRGISAAGQQHGSVYWNADAERILAGLNSSKTLQDQAQSALSHPYSPNWQDSSTQAECKMFESALGTKSALAQVTGSKAHHRFTGPQSLRLRQKCPEAYAKTARISLVSSFVASMWLGKIAPCDVSDVCGMNLYNIREGSWDERLVKLAAGESGLPDLRAKLGNVPEDGGSHLGSISSYYVERYGFSPECTIVISTGDNPATILALPLRSQDAVVSLGTSTTFLMSTPKYRPDPATHFMNHPTTTGLYMFMLCCKNGGLAREDIRDALKSKAGSQTTTSLWTSFDEALCSTPPLCQRASHEPMKLGLYFPKPEIVPELPSGQWHFVYHKEAKQLIESDEGWLRPEDDARAIVESQMLSLRLRSKGLVSSPGYGLPPQPRRIYLVGGSSRNKAIAKVVGEVLGGSEGIYKLDVGGNACALGAAYKAVWSLERRTNETFEELIGDRWEESQFVKRIADGYQEGIFEKYGEALDGFEMMENILMRRHNKD